MKRLQNFRLYVVFGKPWRDDVMGLQWKLLNYYHFRIYSL